MILPDYPIKNEKDDQLRRAPLAKKVDLILEITKTEDYLKNAEKQAKVRDLEHQIDELVYKLYGLTNGEIKIVESK